MIRTIKNLSSSIKFFLSVIILYLLIAIFNQDYFSLISFKLLKNIIEILPILLFVYFLLFLINLFIKPEKIKKHLGHDSGIKGWAYAVIGSIFIAGPPYVLFPILNELKKHGMKDSLIATFMNNRNVQLPFLPVMVYYFGLPFTVIMSVYILLFAILNGVIVGKLVTTNKTGKTN